MNIWNTMEKNKIYGDGGHSAVIRTFPFGSLNRRICGSLSLAQISQSETSHILRTLGIIGGDGFKKVWKRRFGI